jgi:hypothetical protein
VGSGGVVPITDWLASLNPIVAGLSGCAVASGIFKGGMGVGIFVGAVVVILIVVLLG